MKAQEDMQVLKVSKVSRASVVILGQKATQDVKVQRVIWDLKDRLGLLDLLDLLDLRAILDLKVPGVFLALLDLLDLLGQWDLRVLPVPKVSKVLLDQLEP